ncbi:hypothetical protein NLG97_g358 [Lecanicillium saksenae]|uniref:Uncharacterized protein n=1 Tax=Lecanicillium saksenae TaxID=468837 RepID=A0ACC1R8R6_9HYPO|nr:hypothetical protein NLG97_g358 [Lecanicillium saksenae]
MSGLAIRTRATPTTKHIQRAIDDLELLGSDRTKFSQALILICVTSTRDAKSLEKLFDYDEGDIIRLVRQRLSNLCNLQHCFDDRTREHQVALISCVFELARAVKNHRQHQLLDDTRTLQQNRQTYLSILGIDSDATCVKIDEVTNLTGKCKILSQDQNMDQLRQLVRPDYLPIRTRERLPWGLQYNITYRDAQHFTAFAATIAHEFNLSLNDDYEALFIIFQRFQSAQLGLLEANLDPLRNRLRKKILERQSPAELVLYVVASFAMCKDKHARCSIHEFLNCETNDVSRATIDSLTRALDKAMRAWPIRSSQAEKFMSFLLGDAFDGKKEKNVSTEISSTCMDWDEYWYLRFEGQADHDLAKAIVCGKLYKK